MGFSIKTLLFKRGTDTKLKGFTPSAGEPIFTTDKKELFIGDGVTQGGIPVGTVKTDGNVALDNIALFKDTSGKVLHATSKATLLQGYATEQFVTTSITDSVPAIKVNSAGQADIALNAQKLNNRSDYLNSDNVTDSYSETTQGKIVSSLGINNLFNTLKGLIDGLKTSKINVVDITSDLTSTSTSKVSSAAALKTVNDKVDTITPVVNNALTKANQAITDAAVAKQSGDTAQTLANKAQASANTNLAQLNNLPKRVTKGVVAPSGGQDGDIYLQYK